MKQNNEKFNKKIKFTTFIILLDTIVISKLKIYVKRYEYK